MPDPTVMAEIRRMIALPKAWVASGEMTWVDAEDGVMDTHLLQLAETLRGLVNVVGSESADALDRQLELRRVASCFRRGLLRDREVVLQRR